MKYISGQSQLRLIKRVTKNKPFMKAREIENILYHANRVISERKRVSSNMELDRAIFVSQANTCNKIMEEMKWEPLKN